MRPWIEAAAIRRTLTREVRAAYSYLAGSDPAVAIGIGRAEGADEVRVRWVDGRLENFGPRAAGLDHVLSRSSGLDVVE